MKRFLTILLSLMLILTSLSAAIAEDIEEDSIVTADQLAAEMSSMDADTAFVSYAKACAVVVSLMSNQAYNVATGAYNYGKPELVKALMLSDDVWAVNQVFYRNSKDHTLTDLNNAVIGYKNLLQYKAILDALIAEKPEVPEKYKHVDTLITTSQSKLNECLDTFTKWADGTDDSTAMKMWGKVEPLYWDDSISTLIGLNYLDGRLSE